MADVSAADAGVLMVSATLQRDAFTLEVELDVAPGEVVGLTGNIGSGKSSVLGLIAGWLTAIDGRVALGGTVWDEPATATFVEARPVSVMAQSYLTDLPEDRTGFETVRSAIAHLDPNHADNDTAARTILEGLGIEAHVYERLPWTFSGAEAQRIALARAVTPRPSVLLLDEPFGALDKRTGAAVREWLGGWFTDFTGVAVIASTRTDHLEACSQRIVTLDP